MSNANKPIYHPDRPKTKFSPFKAMYHMRKLIADKEDTDQVFRIIVALDGGSLPKMFDRFSATENGQKLIERGAFLAQELYDRREEWRALPDGSFGRAYVDFMEAEGLTAMGLVEESQKRPEYNEYDDIIYWFTSRLRDTHDLFHVLSGYGRDALGEAALLGFSHRQYYSHFPGTWFIHKMAAREHRKYAPDKKLINATMKQAQNNGEKANKIIEQDLKDLFPRPLAEVRDWLGIGAPHHYYEAPQSVCGCEHPYYTAETGAVLNVPVFA